MMRAWRTDSGEEKAATGAGPAPPSGAGAIGLGRLGAAVARAGRAAWARSLVGRADRFEEALAAFAEELEASGDPGAIEAALIRLVRRIEPGALVEVARAAVGRTGGVDGISREVPLRWGPSSHGVLRLRDASGRGWRADRPGSSRRLAMACAMAACALEGLRRPSGPAPEAEDEAVEATTVEVTVADDPGARAPRRRTAVVRDATFLNAVLPFALGQSRRYGDPVSLLCVQVDRLGAIRDLLGASMADGLVHELGQAVASLVRSSDIVARLDDDRVVALLVRARGDGAMKVARSIVRAVEESGLGSPRLPGVSVSIGVAEFPEAADDAASLLQAADEAMAEARARGGASPVLAGSRAVLSASR